VLERTQYSVRSQSDFTLFPVHTERFKKSFFPSTTKLWNGLDTSVRNLPAISRFKKVLLDLFNLQPSRTLFNYSLDRYSSIIHTWIRFYACALNYYLFKIGSKFSPKCTCDFEIETINHYFLYCPIFAAQRLKLLTSAASIFADRCLALSNHT
jgi:hypothetical protein